MVYFFIAIFIGSILLRSSKVKGFLGEFQVRVFLLLLKRKGYLVIHNLKIPNVSGKTVTTEIDHVVISRYGIFVIETKNHGGMIFGKEDEYYWTQKFRNKHKEKIYNPIRQNQGHINSLKALLPEYSERSIISIVAFTRRAKLIKVEATSSVVYVTQVNRTIRNHRTPVLSDADVQKIYQRLERSNVKGLGSKKQHVQSIRDAVAERSRQVDAGICPRCGGQLVERNGKHGVFTGCSSYPKCRFTANVEGV